MRDMIERTYGGNCDSQYTHKWQVWYHCGDRHMLCDKCKLYRHPLGSFSLERLGSKWMAWGWPPPDCVAMQSARGG